MRIEPDAGSARSDEDRLDELVAGCLTAAGCAAGTWTPTDLRYPGLHATAHRTHRTQRARRTATPALEQSRTGAPAAAGAGGGAASGALEQTEERVRAMVLRARRSQARARFVEKRTGWAVDLAPSGEDHLAQSVRRALRQAPAPADGSRGGRTAEVTDWSAEQHEVFEEGCRVLQAAWPQMLAELRVTLRQVALLGGWGIDGFTDFTVHGAVFVNSRRLGDQGTEGLAGRFRLVEALVHEGTHNRCDSAAASAAFLRASGAQELASTPLRADPRPLAGLFQQVAVLARSVLLYRRLPDGPAVRDRHAVLLEQGGRGAATLRGRAGALTDAGRELLDQAEAVFATGAP
ncbi:aKG-HExxH-type peptide beta-hydroxylase [Streptomyces uncialis]|uniref:aKG-HExxH-type peptide beta-hydroxylase n=1 Tax=Streptomyces uncialis TaxID=1048205 RepID=UPI0037BB26C6